MLKKLFCAHLSPTSLVSFATENHLRKPGGLCEIRSSIVDSLPRLVSPHPFIDRSDPHSVRAATKEGTRASAATEEQAGSRTETGKSYAA
jgi:hypothetical protein